MVNQDSGTLARRSVREDMAWSAATAAPLLGCLGGLHRQATTRGSFGLGYDSTRPAMKGSAGIVEIAVLADLALGGAIRDIAGLALPLPTISLTVQVDSGTPGSVVSATASAETLTAGSTASVAQLQSSEGQVVGRCQGLFAVPPLAHRGPTTPMPWDAWDQRTASTRPAGPMGSGPAGASSETGGSGGADQQTPELRRVADRIVEHSLGTPVEGWMTSDVRSRLSLDSAGRSTFTPSEVMANRAGNIQGGVLFGVAALVSGGVEGFGNEHFVSGTMDFIAAASLDDVVTARVAVLRATRRTLFCDVHIEQTGQLVARASTVLRR